MTCLNGGSCNELTGLCNCLDDCEGSDCSQKKDDNTKTIIIATCSVGGVILLLIAGCWERWDTV